MNEQQQKNTTINDMHIQEVYMNEEQLWLTTPFLYLISHAASPSIRSPHVVRSNFFSAGGLCYWPSWAAHWNILEWDGEKSNHQEKGEYVMNNNINNKHVWNHMEWSSKKVKHLFEHV